jgi:hypothetical protein
LRFEGGSRFKEGRGFRKGFEEVEGVEGGYSEGRGSRSKEGRGFYKGLYSRL